MPATITKAARNAGKLDVRLSASVFEIIRAMPDSTKWDGPYLLFKMSRANIEYIKQHFPDAKWEFGNEQVDAIMEMMEEEAVALQRKITRKKDIPQDVKDFPFKMTPRDFQLEDFTEYRDRKYFGLFWEQGLGKTKFILDVSAYKWSIGHIDTLLVMAPNGVHAQWILEQVPKQLPDWVPRKCVYWQPEKTKKFERLVQEVHDFEEGLRIFAINQEALITDRGEKFVLDILDKHLTFWVIDESGSIAKPSATRSKLSLKLAQRAEARAILDGTPVGVGMEDMFTPLEWLDPKILGFTSFYSARHHFCEMQQVFGAPAGTKEVTGYRNVSEFQKKMHAHCSRRTAEECLDLPDRIYSKRYVEFTSEQRRLYNEVLEESIAALESGEIVTAEQAVVRLIRLQQITCGFVKDENGVVHNIKNNRLSSTVDWAKQVTGKFIVWARFHQDIDNLSEALKDFNPVVWDGRTSGPDRIEAKRRFMEDSECLGFIANQGSAGTGVDGLQLVSHSMNYYSNSFKAKERWQSEARLHRMGQQGTVFVTDTVIRNSTDIKLLNILQKRKDTADMVLDTPLEEVLNEGATKQSEIEAIFDFMRDLRNEDA